ncbi:PAS domain-containing protein [Devosia alba]|uniref:PAS domain-containing protein n=1 Tax=Devosia alba TaxID=3152360 RepID=UPI003D36D03F
MDDSTGPAPSRVAESVDLSRLTLSIQDVLDTIPAGAIVVDPLGVMLAVNAEVGRQFGYEPEDLLGRSVDILVPAGPRDGHAALPVQGIGVGSNARNGTRALPPGAAQGWLAFPDRSGVSHVSQWGLSIRPGGGIRPLRPVPGPGVGGPREGA